MKDDAPPFQVIHAFPTMIVRRQWDDIEALNKDLAARIDRRLRDHPDGLQRSNYGGTWHSDTELLEWSGEAGQKLGQMFAKIFGAIADAHGGTQGGQYKLNLSAWAMIANDRGYATVHSYPNCHWSGVYYVDAGPRCGADKKSRKNKDAPRGNADVNGQIEFVDTRAVGQTDIAGLITNPAMRLAPAPGLMVAFPSWVPPFVHPIKGKGRRISISCNATMQYEQPQEKKSKEPVDAVH